MDEPKEKQPKTPEELAEIAYLDKLRTCEGRRCLRGQAAHRKRGGTEMQGGGTAAEEEGRVPAEAGEG